MIFFFKLYISSEDTFFVEKSLKNNFGCKVDTDGTSFEETFVE